MSDYYLCHLNFHVHHGAPISMLETQTYDIPQMLVGIDDAAGDFAQ